jgi:hypothetical protein
LVDSREKGARGETQARDLLRKYTGLNWERVPGSGALDPKHGLKADLYLPNANNVAAIEVKCYADDHLTSAILTSKTPQFITWWEQTLRESAQVGKHPMLLFKFDRSKWFIAFKAMDYFQYDGVDKYIELAYDKYSIAIMKAEDWMSAHAKQTKWVVN